MLTNSRSTDLNCNKLSIGVSHTEIYMSEKKLGRKIKYVRSVTYSCILRQAKSTQVSRCSLLHRPLFIKGSLQLSFLTTEHNPQLLSLNFSLELSFPTTKHYPQLLSPKQYFHGASPSNVMHQILLCYDYDPDKVKTTRLSNQATIQFLY